MSASEPERLHTSVLVAPAAERRRLRAEETDMMNRLMIAAAATFACWFAM